MGGLLSQPQNPNSANRRVVTQAPVSSNVLGTPWPALYGTRDLNGTVIAWTNHSFSSAGSSGKGGGQVSAGEKDYRTFALGLCLGPVDRITQILYDNNIIWQGNVGIASAATAGDNTIGWGGVVLSASDGRGTIAFYFGLENQGPDPVLQRFVPNAPWYRGKCYAVFHGDRTGDKGFQLGNADTLAQIALRITRVPAGPPGLPWAATVGANPGNQLVAEIQPVTVTTDISGWSSAAGMIYQLVLSQVTTLAGLTTFDGFVTVAVGFDWGNNLRTPFTVNKGVPFAVGSLGLMVTLDWPDASIPPLRAGTSDEWAIEVAAAAAATGGADMASVVYELLTTSLYGVALPPAVLDLDAFVTAYNASASIGINYAITEKNDARSLLLDLLKNHQAALILTNGKLGPRLLLGSPTGSPSWILQADDIIAVKARPGAWYELPRHVTVKFRDINRKFRDTIVSIPGAGDFGDDEPNVEIDLPMITDVGTARLVGQRLRTLLCLPKTPDVFTFGRNAFVLQFGDSVAVNDPANGFSPGDTLVVIGVREHAVGDERVELDLAPDIFGSLPADSYGAGGGGGPPAPVPPSQPMQGITIQDAFELPWDFATDESRRFTVFAARPEPDAEGFTVWAAPGISPTDFNEVFDDAAFCAGGTIQAASFRGFTMDREAYIDFLKKSDDINAFTSVSDTDWWGYQFLILLGSGDTATLFAAKELAYLGSDYFRIRGLLGPLSDTLSSAPPGEHLGSDVWVFRLQPSWSILAQPSWVDGSVVVFKGLSYGSRMTDTLANTLAATATVNSRASRPFPADNLVANGKGTIMNPTYSGDINLNWVLRNRGFGFGYETHPFEFDPTIATEISTCDVEVYNGGTLVRTQTVAVRPTTSTSVAAGSWTSQSFSVASATGLQPGDRISVVPGAGPGYFGRIASISGTTVSLVSPLPIVPADGNTVNRYESIGYVYDAATNEADNSGSLASALHFKVWPNLNGLRALAPAELDVIKI